MDCYKLPVTAKTKLERQERGRRGEGKDRTREEGEDRTREEGEDRTREEGELRRFLCWRHGLLQVGRYCKNKVRKTGEGKKRRRER
jgi:hypothetical protein